MSQLSLWKLDNILPHTIKKKARLDKYFGRFGHFCVKTFDPKYRREFLPRPGTTGLTNGKKSDEEANNNNNNFACWLGTARSIKSRVGRICVIYLGAHTCMCVNIVAIYVSPNVCTYTDILFPRNHARLITH